MRYLLLSLFLFTLLPTPVHAGEQSRLDAITVATELGVYDPIDGDERWVYTDYCPGTGSLVVSYRVHSADGSTVTLVRLAGDVNGRWQDENEVVFLPGCWDYLHALAEGV